MNDTLIRDRIILGINTQNTGKKLLQVRKLTLNQCIDVCQSAEATALHMKAFQAPVRVRMLLEWARNKKIPSKNHYKSKIMIGMIGMLYHDNRKPTNGCASIVVASMQPKEKNVQCWKRNAWDAGPRTILRKFARIRNAEFAE